MLCSSGRRSNLNFKEEIYQFKAPYDPKKLHMLLRLDPEQTDFSKGKRADKDYGVSWIKHHGKGRVFYCSLGHNDHIFANPAVLQHYLKGIQWALGDLEVEVEYPRVMWRIIQTIGNLFWLWTILGTAWAWFVPDHFTWFITGKFPGTDVRLINLGLGVIMLGMGITLSVDDFKAVLLRPWVVVLGVAAQFLIMPLLGWTVATLFNLPPMLKLGLILVSCCPGGTASNVICYLARANVALSVLMTMCSTLAAIVLTPLLTKLYASAILDVDAWAMFRSMVTIVLLPGSRRHCAQSDPRP